MRESRESCVKNYLWKKPLRINSVTTRVKERKSKGRKGHNSNVFSLFRRRRGHLLQDLFEVPPGGLVHQATVNGVPPEGLVGTVGLE